MFDGQFGFEAFSEEFEELQGLLAQSAADEEALQLEHLADEVEMLAGDSEEELVENLRFTAEQNPVSETAVDLRMEALKVLNKYSRKRSH